MMDTRLLPLFVFLAALPVAWPAHALQSCRAASGAQVRPLVELYTSEGCDSCPPADRWLAASFPAVDTGSRGIALAFHVDYWDRLGWADRFAMASYTERQHAAMRANRATFVYTPQVLLQGHDLLGWQNAGAAMAEAASRAPARATIALDATGSGSADTINVSIDVQIADATAAADTEVLVAYADSGLSSDVKAGENRGKRLAHDHVVRALRTPGRPDRQGHLHATFDFARPREAGSAPTLVAFVQRISTGDVLQALALPLDRCGAS
jgi:hypothetical protein